MAGFNYTIITKGSWDKSPRVVLCFLVFLTTVLFPGSAFSDYRIFTRDHQISTSSYCIEGNKLYLHEGGEPLELSEVTSISEESLTPLDAQMNFDATKRFTHYLWWLQEIEDGILKRQGDNLDTLQTIDDLRASHSTSSLELKKTVKAFCAELDDLELEVSVLKHYWDQMRIPQRSLVLARDIKSLQLLSLESSLQHRRRYIRTWDPTYLEYTREYDRQAISFEQGFYEALHQEKRYKE